MLVLLHIENIAIIERADILFGRGFNALTGETGAGKSIVIDALGAVLGQRTSRELIRTGAEKAFVSATFSAVPADLPGLAENGFTPEEDGTLLLQRELYGDGKNVCRVGGRPVTVAQLKRIGASLLNIHGQHDGQQLLDEEQHLVYLDRFGRVENELAAYCTRYDVMKETRRAIDALKMDEAEKARRVDMLHHQIGELERADLQEGEEETLLARRNILRNGEKFISAISEADACLNGGDEGLGAVSAIKEAEDALRLIRNAGRVSSFCNDVIGDICGVISGSAAAVISARVLLLSKSGSEIFITLLLSAVVSGMTVGGKACGKSLAMNSSTAVVRTAAKVLCFFRTLPQRLEKKSAKK